jgi:hypothetical protein
MAWDEFPRAAPIENKSTKAAADFEPNRPRLRKAQMMGIGWFASANRAGLRSNEFQVGLVAQAFGLGDS